MVYLPQGYEATTNKYVYTQICYFQTIIKLDRILTNFFSFQKLGKFKDSISYTIRNYFENIHVGEGSNSILSALKPFHGKGLRVQNETFTIYFIDSIFDESNASYPITCITPIKIKELIKQSVLKHHSLFSKSSYNSLQHSDVISKNIQNISSS